VPYRDQVDLPVFDTRELTFSWNSLFRDNRFGGADRQADANQATLALTTRILRADDGSERLSAGSAASTTSTTRGAALPGDPPGRRRQPWIATSAVAVRLVEPRRDPPVGPGRPPHRPVLGAHAAAPAQGHDRERRLPLPPASLSRRRWNKPT
jgi:hypothetical protein